MLTCPSCGRENPADFAFCPGCGTKLDGRNESTGREPAATAATENPRAVLTEERKVVTTLFCDLVSFTAHSEAADYELIDVLLQQYNDTAKRLVESHGGVVEKYIGDAVVAAFGFPSAHDDDAERALRCAFRLVEEVGKLTWPDHDAVQIHIGANTGEIYLHRDVDPSSGGSFLTGDAVNTAARLEAASPANGIVVGELTHELTKHAAVYDELTPLTVKGKKKPVRAWLAKELVQVRSRTGIRTTGSVDTPFVGRKKELKKLLAAFDRAVASNQAQFVLLVGEPGIGKSRLVLELARSLDDRPETITWRQGRCPAFGQGAGLAAFSDIVKASAGILDSDDVVTVEAKLEAALEGDDQSSWVRERVGPLLGLEASQASPEESYAAWRRFLLRVARKGRAVFVFEDLHWADEMLLGFLDTLASEPQDAPVLIVCTTRPELLGRDPETLVESERVARLLLSPLSREDASRLVASLLDRKLAADVREPMLERAGGNPLYAEEYVRLLLDRGLLLESDGVIGLKSGEQLPLPDTVQAVLAARLDTLPPEHKALLCDAAVFGETFWDGGVAAVGGRHGAQVEQAIALLIERQLVRRVVSSSLADQAEFLFWHALARDVAYAEIPKRARIQKHVDAAQWIETQAGDRVEDVADVLAHHYVTALELAEALRDDAVRASLVEPALRYLNLAGTKAWALDDPPGIERCYGRALELAPAEHPDRAYFLMRWGKAVDDSGRHEEAVHSYDEVIRQSRAKGDLLTVAEVMLYKAAALDFLGRPDAHEHSIEAVAILEAGEPCRELVMALWYASVGEGNLGRPDKALEFAERGLAAARQIGCSPEGDDWKARYYWCAVATRGDARCLLGDAGGLDDLREAGEAHLARGWDPLTVIHFANATFQIEGPTAAIPIYEEIIRRSMERGIRYLQVCTRSLLLEALREAGKWDEVLAASGELMETLKSAEDHTSLMTAEVAVAQVLAQRGETDLAVPLALSSLELAKEHALPVDFSVTLITAATALAPLDQAAATRHLEQLPQHLDSAFATFGVYELPQMLRTAHVVGATELAAELTEWVPTGLATQACVRRYGDALLAASRSEHEAAAAGFADAAARWHGFGVPYEEAQALLGQGRCLMALARAPEAAPVLEQARAIFVRLGAKPALAEAEALRATVSAGQGRSG
jgi:class 3 adenylate cyclase/tetratricopeptide (TPR) repeat protein